MGIAPEEQERIFARFHRGASARSKGPGVGLGLWITRRQVEAMGGVIRVASTREVGSTFTVELPLAGPIPA
jgi:signal transduction histidine kinase